MSYCCHYRDLLRAAESIRERVVLTKLVTSSVVSRACGRRVFFKDETSQWTGSFKVRGVWNVVENLRKEHRLASCLIAASTGNHGKALAYVARNLGLYCRVTMPESCSKRKKSHISDAGALVSTFDGSYEHMRRQIARACASTPNSHFVSSSTPLLIAGQGTVGVEIMQQLPTANCVIVPVGSGGLLAGVALAVKAVNPHVLVYGVESEVSCSCYRSKKSGRLFSYEEMPDSVADGIRTNLSANAWPIVRDLVDDVILVTEEEIRSACSLYLKYEGRRIEPSAGAVVAALLGQSLWSAIGMNSEVKDVVAVLTGGNADDG